MKEALKYNDLDTYYKTDRRSLTGKYEVIQGVPRLGHVPFSLLGILGDPGADSGGKGKSKRAGKYGAKKSKERREEPLGTMSYQTSSKRSLLF